MRLIYRLFFEGNGNSGPLGVKAITCHLNERRIFTRDGGRAVRDGLRLEGGGYRRDHLRALAQRVEVADTEVRIMGSNSELLRTLVAASRVKSAALAFIVLY